MAVLTPLADPNAERVLARLHGRDQRQFWRAIPHCFAAYVRSKLTGRPYVLDDDFMRDKLRRSRSRAVLARVSRAGGRAMADKLPGGGIVETPNDVVDAAAKSAAPTVSTGCLRDARVGGHAPPHGVLRAVGCDPMDRSSPIGDQSGERRALIQIESDVELS